MGAANQQLSLNADWSKGAKSNSHLTSIDFVPCEEPKLSAALWNDCREVGLPDTSQCVSTRDKRDHLSFIKSLASEIFNVGLQILVGLGNSRESSGGCVDSASAEGYVGVCGSATGGVGEDGTHGY